MEARRGRRRRDPTSPAGLEPADEDAIGAARRSAHPVAKDIRADDRGLAAQRFRPTRLTPLSWRPPRPHLRTVRRLRELRSAGQLAPAHRVRHG